ncbi:zinc finger protein, putative [Plasmodium sp. gorilla clade G3]|nr:zinc finger protein, putative [Plasmodium sp. gorilla clade G3]
MNISSFNRKCNKEKCHFFNTTMNIKKKYICDDNNITLVGNNINENNINENNINKNNINDNKNILGQNAKEQSSLLNLNIPGEKNEHECLINDEIFISTMKENESNHMHINKTCNLQDVEYYNVHLKNKFYKTYIHSYDNKMLNVDEEGEYDRNVNINRNECINVNTNEGIHESINVNTNEGINESIHDVSHNYEESLPNNHMTSNNNNNIVKSDISENNVKVSNNIANNNVINSSNEDNDVLVNVLSQNNYVEKKEECQQKERTNEGVNNINNDDNKNDIHNDDNKNDVHNDDNKNDVHNDDNVNNIHNDDNVNDIHNDDYTNNISNNDNTNSINNNNLINNTNNLYNNEHTNNNNDNIIGSSNVSPREEENEHSRETSNMNSRGISFIENGHNNISNDDDLNYYVITIRELRNNDINRRDIDNISVEDEHIYSYTKCFISKILGYDIKPDLEEYNMNKIIRSLLFILMLFILFCTEFLFVYNNLLKIKVDSKLIMIESNYNPTFVSNFLYQFNENDLKKSLVTEDIIKEEIVKGNFMLYNNMCVIMNKLNINCNNFSDYYKLNDNNENTEDLIEKSIKIFQELNNKNFFVYKMKESLFAKCNDVSNKNLNNDDNYIFIYVSEKKIFKISVLFLILTIFFLCLRIALIISRILYDIILFLYMKGFRLSIESKKKYLSKYIWSVSTLYLLEIILGDECIVWWLHDIDPIFSYHFQYFIWVISFFCFGTFILHKILKTCASRWDNTNDRENINNHGNNTNRNTLYGNSIHVNPLNDNHEPRTTRDENLPNVNLTNNNNNVYTEFPNNTNNNINCTSISLSLKCVHDFLYGANIMFACIFLLLNLSKVPVITIIVTSVVLFIDILNDTYLEQVQLTASITNTTFQRPRRKRFYIIENKKKKNFKNIFLMRINEHTYRDVTVDTINKKEKKNKVNNQIPFNPKNSNKYWDNKNGIFNIRNILNKKYLNKKKKSFKKTINKNNENDIQDEINNNNSNKNLQENYEHNNSIISTYEYCEICDERNKNVVLHPCMHGGFCEACIRCMIFNSLKLKDTYPCCPLCRNPIENVYKISYEDDERKVQANNILTIKRK